MKGLKFIVIGILFGIVLSKSEAASWYRIQEMFRFQSFHMYGLMGVAVILGISIILLIKKFKMRDYQGNLIVIPSKEKSIVRYLLGGGIFGLGWALTGACPGPMFVNLAQGFVPMSIVILSAMAGTFLYGLVRHKLPH